MSLLISAPDLAAHCLPLADINWSSLPAKPVLLFTAAFKNRFAYFCCTGQLFGLLGSNDTNKAVHRHVHSYSWLDKTWLHHLVLSAHERVGHYAGVVINLQSCIQLLESIIFYLFFAYGEIHEKKTYLLLNAYMLTSLFTVWCRFSE